MAVHTCLKILWAAFQETCGVRRRELMAYRALSWPLTHPSPYDPLQLETVSLDSVTPTQNLPLNKTSLEKGTWQ